jgi:hypothetical protein
VQEAAKRRLYAMLNGEGGMSAEALAQSPVLDIEQFALRAGRLRHEAKRGKWAERYCLLWRDPAACGGGGTMMLLIYETDTAERPLEVVALPEGKYTATPPKTPRKAEPYCFRLNVQKEKGSGECKWVLSAFDEPEHAGWLSALTQDAAAQLINPGADRESAKAAKQKQDSKAAKAIWKLGVDLQQPKNGGLLAVVKRTPAEVLGGAAAKPGATHTAI